MDWDILGTVGTRDIGSYLVILDKLGQSRVYPESLDTKRKSVAILDSYVPLKKTPLIDLL